MDGDEQRHRFLILLRPIEGDLENYSLRQEFDRRSALSRNQRMPRHDARQCDGKSLPCAPKNARLDSALAKENVAMKCAEVRKFVQLYLDSELDARNSFEVEQHLESCPEC